MSVLYSTDKSSNSRIIPRVFPPVLGDQTVNSWTRPVDWLSLPSVSPTEHKIVGLYGVSNSTGQFIALQTSVSVGSYTVDWGDGVVENFSSGTQANHQYNYSTITSTVTSDGMKQVIVQVYPLNVAATFTNITLQSKYNNTTVLKGGTLNAYSTGWLDLIVSAPSAGTITVGGSTVLHAKLQQFQLLSCGNIGSFDVSYCYELRNITYNFSGASAINMQNMFYQCFVLQVVPAIPWNKCTNAFQMFYGCYSLTYVPDATTSMNAGFTGASSVTRYMFYQCYALKRAPWLDTSKSYDCQNMFNSCFSLEEVPNYDFSTSTGFQSMFQTCYLLTSVPSFKTSSALTTCQSMFQDCYSLVRAPSFNTVNVNNMQSMFQNCYDLVEAPWMDTGNVTTMFGTFTNCRNLTSVPLYNLIKVTNTSSMFTGCNSLDTVPLFNTSNVTNMVSMFSSSGVTTVPDFDTANCISTSGMFGSCRALISAPNINTIKVTDTGSMFDSCSSMKSCPTYNTSNVTTMTNMFNGCSSLQSAPAFDTTKVTNMSGMFNGAKSLKSIPTYNTANVTNLSNFLNQADGIVSFPTINTSKVTNFSFFVSGASLDTIPALDMGNATTLGTLTSNGNNVSVMNATGMKVSFSVTGQKMGKTELETMFTNITPNATSQTVTITNNWGADPVVSKTATWTTSTKDVSITVSGNVVAGMQAYGVIQTPIACTFTDATDMITTSGGVIAPVVGSMVTFPTITSTTGITTNTLYYVVYSTIGTNFQVSLTPGGAPVTLTTNGTGTVKWSLQVTNVATNTVTLNNYPMINGTSQTITFRYLNTNAASFKNWTITG